MVRSDGGGVFAIGAADGDATICLTIGVSATAVDIAGRRGQAEETGAAAAHTARPTHRAGRSASGAAASSSHHGWISRECFDVVRSGHII